MENRTNLITGVCALMFGAIAVFLWIPLDIRTGIVETVRRRVVIGDSMAPTAYAIGIIIVGACMAISARRGTTSDPTIPGLDRKNAIWILAVAAILACSIVLMATLGPLTVQIANALEWETRSYRQLIDTAPYKYIGFAAGGFCMVVSLTSLIAHRPSWRLAAVSAASVALMIVLYDVPFDDLLLPPNGDQ